MVKKMAQFQTLTGKRETVNPKFTALKVELAHVEDEIEKLLNTLTGASAVLISYANTKIEELDAQRQTLSKEIAALSAESMSPEQIERLSVYLNRWELFRHSTYRYISYQILTIHGGFPNFLSILLFSVTQCIR